MIVEKIIGNRIWHYSTRNMMIRQLPTGIVYEEAIDVLPCSYTYEETSDKIPDKDITDIDKAEAYDILMGGTS